MKKLKVLIIVLVLMLSAASVTYAAVVPQPEIEPHYVGAAAVLQIFEIESDGTAAVKAVLIPKTESMVDRVTVTITVKNDMGVTVHNENYNARWSTTSKEYVVEDEFDLSNRGIYICTITYKPYLDNHLLETIVADPIMKAY